MTRTTGQIIRAAGWVAHVTDAFQAAIHAGRIAACRDDRPRNAARNAAWNEQYGAACDAAQAVLEPTGRAMRRSAVELLPTLITARPDR
jgi:hypothetical protein